MGLHAVGVNLIELSAHANPQIAMFAPSNAGYDERVFRSMDEMAASTPDAGRRRKS
jgi:hypothetical protein